MADTESATAHASELVTACFKALDPMADTERPKVACQPYETVRFKALDPMADTERRKQATSATAAEQFQGTRSDGGY